jgi:acyl-CoA synthetase (AMP-forming)/AMP-acid ligase II
VNVGFGTIWEAVSDTLPDEVVVVEPGRRFTFAEFENRSARLARAFEDAGVHAGDTVACYLYNSAAYLETVFASFKIGAIPVNVNYRYKAGELTSLLADADATAIVFDADLEEQVAHALSAVSTLRLAVRTGRARRVPDLSADVVDLDDLLATRPPRPRRPRPGTDRLFVYTGGTTGRPKGVVWQQRDLLHTLAVPVYGQAGLPLPETLYDAVAAAERAHREHLARATLPVVPLMHATGLFLTIGTLLLGGRSVLQGTRGLDPHAAWRAVAAEQVDTIILGGNAVAAPLVGVLEDAEERGEPHDLSTLRAVVSSGAVLSDRIKAALHERAAVTIIDTLGTSEGGPFAFAITRSVADLPARFFPAPATRLLREDGTVIPATCDEVGVLAFGGPQPLGYHKDPEKTAQTFRVIDGVRYTSPGDLAQLLADGSIKFLGRQSGVINTGGEKVHPHEIEEVLLTHPAIRDAVVVGVPEPRWGEQVAAVVSAEDGHELNEATVERHVRSTLADYKVPRVVAIVPAVLRTTTGKAELAWARRTAAEAAVRSVRR